MKICITGLGHMTKMVAMFILNSYPEPLGLGT